MPKVTIGCGFSVGKVSKHWSPISCVWVDVIFNYVFCHVHISQSCCSFLEAKFIYKWEQHTQPSENKWKDNCNPTPSTSIAYWTATTMLSTCCTFTKSVFVLLIVTATCQLAITAPTVRRCTTSLSDAEADLRNGLLVARLVSFQFKSTSV